MFSGVVKIADIDDYITPSQNCIKPLLDKEKESSKVTIKNESKIQIELSGDTNISEDLSYQYSEPDLIKKDKNKKTAKVSLNDCLACNGCVTTAETLLIQAQSVDEFLKNSLNANIDGKLSIVCISPQSVLSLANYYSLTSEETLKRLCKVFASCGVNYVLNFNTATYLTLLECYKEFKERVIDNKQEKELNNFIISSECPGWICYAEKKVGEWVIPYLSKIKSPQQILGHLLKNIFKEKFYKEVYLTCVMPCFDKKLEATRETHRFNQNLEVDTVVSTLELLELFEKLNIDFSNLENNNSNSNLFIPFFSLLNSSSTYDLSSDYKTFFSTDENYSSNGYSEFFLGKYIQETFSNNPEVKFKIERKSGKNSDYKEIFLYVENSENDKPILSMCLIYGFRNIQNILRNKNKIKYNYLEVMACPGGCINGGGQMRPRSENETARDVLRKIEENYNTALLQFNIYEERNKVILDKENFAKILNYEEKSNYESIFLTEFKALDKTSTLNLKW